MHVSGVATVLSNTPIGGVVRVPFTLYSEQDASQIVKATATVTINGIMVPQSNFVVDVIENPLQFAVRNLGIGVWPQAASITVEADYRVRVTDYPPALSADDWHELLVRGQVILADLTRRIEALEGDIPDDAPPVRDETPTLTGTPEVGSTLTVVPGSWTGYPVPVLTYQWTRDGADIAGQTALTYLVVTGDSGKAIACRETATNSSGSASSTTTALIIDVGAPVVTANQEFTVARPLTVGKVVGTVLATGDPTSWAFTQGNANFFWAIDASGVITIADAGVEGLSDGLYGPKVAATNAYGASTSEAVYLTVE